MNSGKISNRIRYELVQLGKRLQAPGVSGRELAVFSDDVFIVSYPKSGNTWARFLLGNLLHQDEGVTFTNIEQKIPDIYMNRSRLLEAFQRPRVLKSHEYLDPRYRKVIYIVRDPRDVAVSYYHYLIKMHEIDDNYPVEQYVQRFVEGSWDSYGSWGDHVGGWLGARSETDGFLLLQYEDMLDAPEDNLRAMSLFLEIDFTEQMIDQAVAVSSFKNMQKLEKKESEYWSPLKSGRSDKPFVRQAKKGGWRDELPNESVDVIERAWGSHMSRLGYEIGIKQEV